MSFSILVTSAWGKKSLCCICRDHTMGSQRSRSLGLQATYQVERSVRIRYAIRVGTRRCTWEHRKYADIYMLARDILRRKRTIYFGRYDRRYEGRFLRNQSLKRTRGNVWLKSTAIQQYLSRLRETMSHAAERLAYQISERRHAYVDFLQLVTRSK